MRKNISIPEDDTADAGVDQLDGPAGGEEGRDEAEDDEADEDGQEDAAHRREVDLGLEGEDGEAQRDGGAGSHGHHDLNKTRLRQRSCRCLHSPLEVPD